MFDYLRRHEADPSLTPEQPDAAEAAAPPGLRAWTKSSFGSVSPMPDCAAIDEWSSTAVIDPGLQKIPPFLEQLVSQAEPLAKPATGSANTYEWFRTECVGFAAARAALAQRTYLWLADWRAGAQQFDALLAAQPELRKHPSVAPLMLDLKNARPLLVELSAKVANDQQSTRQLQDHEARVTERVAATEMYLGALSCFQEYLFPPTEESPPNMPPRTATQCLGLGTGWLLSRLSDISREVADKTMLTWEQHELANAFKLMTNGSAEETTSPTLRQLFQELGLSLITDMEGIQACVCSHEQAVATAQQNPNATVRAVFVEAHLLTLLTYLLDAVYSRSDLRHNFSSTPQNTPKPEDSLRKKLQLIYDFWERNRDQEI